MSGMPKQERTPEAQLERLIRRHPALEPLRETIWTAYQNMKASFACGGKLLVCGNGGSAADADHIVGELMKGFYLKRPLPVQEREKLGPVGEKLQGALPAIALTQHAGLSTAFLNDVDPFLIYAQQVYDYGRTGDCFLGISTSGNARNVCEAARVARAKGMTTLALTGAGGGTLREICDVCIRVPETVTADIQELHLPVYHALCAMLEMRFFAAAEPENP